MTDPSDQGFVLGDLAFGQSGDVIVESFDPGSYDWRTQDADQAMGNARMFGRDFKTAGTWTWSLGVNRGDEAGAFETLDQLAAAWDPDDVTSTPGALSAMRYRVNGRTRRVYGRPRRFAPAPDVRRLQGYIPVTCDFARADSLHYDDTESVVVLGMQPSSTGGLISPLKSPLTSVNDAGSAGRPGSVVVGGNAPTAVIIEIRGDVSRPWVVAVNRWSIRLEDTVAQGDSRILDARPWVRSITRADGGSAAGTLRGSRLAELVLPPGPQELIFGGTSSTGGATATVRWRAASKSL